MSVFHSYLRRRDPKIIAARASISYTPRQVAEHYNFPLQYTGKGTRTGIIELGGGFVESDLQRYFAALGLPTPKVVARSVMGGQNSPGSDADGEVMLDIEVHGAVAPEAEQYVYFCPNTSAAFAAGIRAAVQDNCDQISVSWGGPESSWSPADIQAMQAELVAAEAAKVSTFVAAGDNGSSDGLSGVNVDFPGSCPNCVSVGGTRLLVAANGALVETVWNDGTMGGAGGGGLSAVFPRPVYQSGLRIAGGNGRAVPDCAALADPVTGYVVLVDGQTQVVGGTSAGAPLLAALNALCVQALGKRVGGALPLLYRSPSAFRDITAGNNGAYAAGVGFDCCTGLGVPDGGRVLAVLRAALQPGNPVPPTSSGSMVEMVVDGSGGVAAFKVNGKAWAPK